VEVQADLIISQSNKLLLTAATEAQSKAGHDFIPFFQGDVLHYADSLEPVDNGQAFTDWNIAVAASA
jgi:hypothetical protein